jgi:uncharacterized PurR-regulated membrane protein YhhQ (DUF165 family)
MRYLALAGFIATIFAANFAITRLGVVSVGFGLMAPAGVYFAGVAFTLRDLLHDAGGRRWVLAAIIGGALLSALVEPRFALASGIAFGVSETADWAIYEPIRRKGWLRAVAASNAAGLTVDSMLFLWLAFGSLAFLPGQLIAKAYMTGVAIAIILVVRAIKAGRNPRVQI